MLRHATARLARRSSVLNIPAAKARVAQWEPALSLPHFPPSNTTQDENLWTTTYSAFDPGMMRPLLLSGVSFDVERINLDVFSVPKSTRTQPLVNMSKSAAHAQHMSVKPWPYSLPAFLRPKLGTTFAMKYGGGLVDLESAGRVGFLQAVLYGVPDPDERGWGKVGVVDVEVGEVDEKKAAVVAGAENSGLVAK